MLLEPLLLCFNLRYRNFTSLARLVASTPSGLEGKVATATLPRLSDRMMPASFLADKYLTSWWHGISHLKNFIELLHYEI